MGRPMPKSVDGFKTLNQKRVKFRDRQKSTINFDTFNQYSSFKQKIDGMINSNPDSEKDDHFQSENLQKLKIDDRIIQLFMDYRNDAGCRDDIDQFASSITEKSSY